MAVDEGQDYKAMRSELDELLEKMRSDELDVDEALASFERGQELIRAMKDHLKTVENKIVQRGKKD